MKRKDRILKSAILASVMCLASTVVHAQDQQSGANPKPPARTYGPIGVQDQQDQDQDQTVEVLEPDTRPLTGFQELTLGSPVERHSYWVPGIAYVNFVQSNGQFQGGSSNWNSTNYINGNITLFENWSRSQLLVNYSGGGYFSTDSASGNGWFQQLGFSQTFHWERLQLVLLDQFAYLPQAQFGFGAGTSLALPGIGGSLGGGVTGFAPGFAPGQSIFTTFGPRYLNTGGVQATYQFTRRSSITVGGLVSILRFTDAGNIESNDYTGNIGYNYQLTRNDTLGLQYRYGSFHYLGLPQAIGNQSILASYGKRITGRWALQLAGGPEITDFRIPEVAGAQTHYVTGSGSASVTYGVPRGSFSVAYFHGLTAGSGVFLGATTDQVSGYANRRVTRLWSGDAH